jgi:hypothetical protein
MLFVVSSVLAVITLGWPCQRLNWAWRNVWVTCSINAYVPGVVAPSAGTTGFLATNAPLGTQAFALDTNGQFQPGVINGNADSGGPLICATSPNTGGSFMRNRCRRMLDVYGNLVKLCGSPVKTPTLGPNTLTPDYEPQTGHAPHVVNVQNLAFMAQSCITPGALYPTPTGTCPGLAGWFTVVWNACMFTAAPGVSTSPSGVPNVPGYLSSSAAPTFSLSTPVYLCGGTTPGSLTPIASAPGAWNNRGVLFRSSRCRKALDQFGRTASRCSPSNTPNGMGVNDVTRFLAQNLGTISPICSN